MHTWCLNFFGRDVVSPSRLIVEHWHVIAHNAQPDFPQRVVSMHDMVQLSGGAEVNHGILDPCSVG